MPLCICTNTYHNNTLQWSWVHVQNGKMFAATLITELNSYCKLGYGRRKGKYSWWRLSVWEWGKGLEQACATVMPTGSFPSQEEGKGFTTAPSSPLPSSLTPPFSRSFSLHSPFSLSPSSCNIRSVSVQSSIDPEMTERWKSGGTHSGSCQRAEGKQYAGSWLVLVWVERTVYCY